VIFFKGRVKSHRKGGGCYRYAKYVKNVKALLMILQYRKKEEKERGGKERYIKNVDDFRVFCVIAISRA